MACRPYVLPERYIVPLVPGDYNTIDRPRGMLFVTVVSAHNVPKMDWFNGSDPYVRYKALPARHIPIYCVSGVAPPGGVC